MATTSSTSLLLVVGSVELRIAPSSAQLTRLREVVLSFLRGVPDDIAHDILLALNEAVVNAIRYGSPEGQPVEVTLSLRDGWINAAVVDHGPGPDGLRVPEATPPTLATRGRGLWLIAQLVDEVRVEAHAGGTRLALRRRAYGIDATA